MHDNEQYRIVQNRTAVAACGPAASPPRPARAFTLIELLTVVLIIGVLAAILMPTLTGVMNYVYATQTRARIRLLDGACQEYKSNTTHAGVFPAQDKLNLPAGTINTSLYGGHVGNGDQGSQIMAWDFFGGSFAHPNPNIDPNTDPNARNFHAEWLLKPVPGMLDCPLPYFNLNGGSRIVSGFTDAVLDCFPKPMPILYYVSIPGITGIAQYNDAQDSAIALQYLSNYTTTMFNQEITNPDISGGGTPYRPAEYLIIGAGVGRTYFSSGEDLLNFGQ